MLAHPKILPNLSHKCFQDTHAFSDLEIGYKLLEILMHRTIIAPWEKRITNYVSWPSQIFQSISQADFVAEGWLLGKIANILEGGWSGFILAGGTFYYVVLGLKCLLNQVSGFWFEAPFEVEAGAGIISVFYPTTGIQRSFYVSVVLDNVNFLAVFNPILFLPISHTSDLHHGWFADSGVSLMESLDGIIFGLFLR